MSLLCPDQVYSEVVPDFKMLMWPRVTIADITTMITETCDVGPSKDFQTVSPGRGGATC